MGQALDFGTALENFEELFGMGLLEMMFSDMSGTLVNLLVYIFSGLGLYTIAKRRGIHNPWLAWVPWANLWLLGSIADHYRYVVRGEVKNRRKVLLGTEITTSLIGMAVLVLCVNILVNILSVGVENLESMDEAMAQRMLAAISGPGIAMVALLLPLLVVAILHTVFYLISLHDIYKSCDPSNATLYLVLGLFFSFAVPVFLMICRKKDNGMVPQQTTAYGSTAYHPSSYMSAAQPVEPQYPQYPQYPQQPQYPQYPQQTEEPWQQDQT